MKNSNKKFDFRKSALTTLVMTALASSSVLSEEVANDENQNDKVNVILVTASKTGAKSIQETPIAITAFDGDSIQESIMSDARSLSQLTPGLTISENTGYAQLYIRGIGSNNVFAGADPSTTIHIDGVYLARPQASFNSFLDVERIEVLRGPQGTLYGRNSVGGTINIISKKPDTEDTDYKLGLLYGNYGATKIDGYFNTPIGDNSAISFAGSVSGHDAYRENIGTGNDLEDDDIKTGRFQYLYEGDEFEAIFRADFFDQDQALYGYHTYLAPPPTPAGQSILGDFGFVSTNRDSRYQRESSGYSLDLSGKVNENWEWKSLTAVRKNDFDGDLDSDASELEILRTHIVEKQDQISQELNFVGNFDSSSYVIGLFYFQQDIVQNPSQIFVFPAGIHRDPAPIVDTTAFAIYGQANFELDDKWSITLGGRYTEEEKDFTKNDTIHLIANDLQVVDLSFPKETGKYSDFSPKLGFEYQSNEDTLYYFTASKGFKSGGFNFTATLPGGYKEEKLTAFEVGSKTSFDDGRIQMNTSVFSYDYTDLQVQSFLVPGAVDITNAATATIQGFEVETKFKPSTDLSWWLNIAYLDAVYDKYPEAPNAGGTFDASGFKLNSSPEWSGSLGAQYDWAVASGTMFFRGEYNFQSEIFFTPVNDNVEHQDNYALTNLFIGYTDNTADWTIELYARNVFDEEYITSSASFTVVPTGRAGPPATYGLQFTYRK